MNRVNMPRSEHSSLSNYKSFSLSLTSSYKIVRRSERERERERDDKEFKYRPIVSLFASS